MLNFRTAPPRSTGHLQAIAENIESIVEKKLSRDEYQMLQRRFSELHKRFYLRVSDKEILVIVE